MSSSPEAKPAAWKGPGVIFDFAKPRGIELSQETLEQWFDEEYVPALLAVGAISSATLYKAANPTYHQQHLILHKIPDLAILQSGALSTVSRTSKKGLFTGSVEEHVDLEARIYTLTQHYEPTKQSEGPAPAVLLAMIQPSEGGESDLDAWYREEHNQQMSLEPGYRRTLRYSLLAQHSNSAEKSEELAFLAVHEFGEGHSLPMDVKPLDPISDWTKKVMGGAKKIDAAIYHRVKDFGGKV